MFDFISDLNFFVCISNIKLAWQVVITGLYGLYGNYLQARLDLKSLFKSIIITSYMLQKYATFCCSVFVWAFVYFSDLAV